ncbi:Nif3-like dinuclear metal center hexameric protein [Peribacillus deserti]|uniref:GTP cyclohydrolase 1 type 2 homolog n=1 Tax=Peribacillus deserti TaxID=673318 RepID=A0A2N5M9I5_9BACI|nr:Nif3-like dinuclear metal center hexameric protein [Peribacillus deserti]PLT30985.1 Nif3-like dinuclear metal center hexameric protein [Peribacillus deserti]
MKQANGHEIIHLLEEFSPKAYAEEGDPIGLQLGKLNKPVSKVIIALDVTEEVVQEAIDAGSELIIAHHPPIFRPLKHLRTDLPQGALYEKIIKHDIAVYAAHTNLDVAKGGVNDLLANALKLQDIKVMSPTYEKKLKKLAVYCPVPHEKALLDALGQAGAGHIGNYSHCSFSSTGTGRFLPEAGTSPYIGTQGKLEAVEEVRIETVYPADIEKKVLQAMFRSHPYEEVAFDIYPLENQGEILGLGRVGKLESEMSFTEFADYVKKALDVEHVRIVGKPDAVIKKVAVLGGDGNKFIKAAKYSGADCFVTGDIYYHTAHDALMMGLNMLDPGHNIEKVMKKGVADVLSRLVEEKGYKTEFIASAIHTDPFTFL